MNIVIADDHSVVRRGLQQIIGTQPAWKIVAEVTNQLTERRYLCRDGSWRIIEVTRTNRLADPAVGRGGQQATPIVQRPGCNR